MLPLDEALQRVLDRLEPLPPETIPVDQAAGRICRENVLAAIDLPPADNSGVDGYAVRAGDLKGAGADSPVILRLAGTVPAGSHHGASLEPGTCIRIFTGSTLPPGADAVAMQEETKSESGDRIGFLSAAAPWENIRFSGEDLKKGSKIVASGERLKAGHLALLAAIGRAGVLVGRRPVVGLLASGSELRQPGEVLRPGEIYESNRAMLATLITNLGGAVRTYPLMRDDLKATESAIATAFEECDSVVTVGGVSVGDFDFVKSAFANLGGEIDFWQVAIKPGKPFVHGRRKEKRLFGLPGNPISSWVTFLLLVRPALLRMQGATELHLPIRRGRLSEALSNRGGRDHFVRVTLDESGNVKSAGLQASHILSTMIQANGLVRVRPNETLAAGSEVPVAIDIQ